MLHTRPNLVRSLKNAILAAGVSIGSLPVLAAQPPPAAQTSPVVPPSPSTQPSPAAQTAPSLQKSSLSVLQSVHVTLKAKKQSLADVTAILSRRAGRGIVVDSLPLLHEADFEFEGTAKDALDKVADVFDYAWSLSKRGVILMHKRFNMPAEYPQMNLPELRETAREVVDILHALPYDTNPRHRDLAMATLYHALTPEQLRGMEQGGNKIYYKDLMPAQQSLMEGVVLNYTFAESCSEWETLLLRLDLLPKAFFQTREWPSYYQQQKGMPVAPAPGLANLLEFDLLESDRNGEEIRIIVASRRKP